MRTLALLCLLVNSAPAALAAPAGPSWSDLAAAGSTLAVTDGAEVRVSRDGGARFVTALAGEGRVAALAIGDDGTVYAVRGKGRLGALPAKGEARWSLVPGAVRTEALVAGGGALVWRGETKDTTLYAVSRDGGATFSPRPAWPVGSFGNVVALDGRGEVHLIAAHEASCGGGYQEHLRGGAAALRPLRWDVDQPFDLAVDEASTAYFLGVCDDSPKPRLCAQTVKALQPVALDAAVAADDLVGLRSATDGDDTWLVSGTLLLRVRGVAGVVVSHTVPKGVARVAVGADHAPLILARGRVYSLEGGTWRRIELR